MAISTNPIWQLRFNQGADSAYNPFVPPKPATQAPAAKPQLPVIGSPQPMRSAANQNKESGADNRNDGGIMRREFTGDFFSMTPGKELGMTNERAKYVPGDPYEEYEKAANVVDFFQGPISMGLGETEAGLQTPGVGWGLSKVADFFTGGMASLATQGLSEANKYSKRKDALEHMEQLQAPPEAGPLHSAGNPGATAAGMGQTERKQPGMGSTISTPAQIREENRDRDRGKGGRDARDRESIERGNRERGTGSKAGMAGR